MSTGDDSIIEEVQWLIERGHDTNDAILHASKLNLWPYKTVERVWDEHQDALAATNESMFPLTVDEKIDQKLIEKALSDATSNAEMLKQLQRRLVINELQEEGWQIVKLKMGSGDCIEEELF